MNGKLAEETEKKANEYAEKHGFRVPYDGSNNFYDDVDVKASKEGFIEGARWMNKMLFPICNAALHTYMCWNGSTMNDVRDSMDDLGKELDKLLKQ